MGSFLQACAGGDMEALFSLLSEDVILWSDGGGKVKAALNPIRGADKVIRWFAGVLQKTPPGLTFRTASVNGRPGAVGYYADGSPQSVVTLDVEGEGIRAIHFIVNPEKLENIPPLEEVER